MNDEDIPLTLRVLVAVVCAVVAAATFIYVCGVLGVALPMWAIDGLFWGGSVAAGAFVFLQARRSDSRPPEERETHGWRSAAFALPLVVLVPAIVVYLRSPRLQMSFHGYLHSAYTYAVLNGAIPPDNPLLAGEPANDYWLFHVLLSSIVHVTHLAPPLAAALMNVASLLGSIYLVSRIARAVGVLPSSPIARGCIALVTMFAFNLFGAVHALFGNGAKSGVDDPMGLGSMVLFGAPRMSGLLAKFLNFNGFPVGVFMFLFALLFAVRMTNRISGWDLLGFLGGALGALAFHVTTGLFTLTALPGAVALSYLLMRGRPQWRMSRATGLVIGAAGVVALAALGHYTFSVASALEGAGAALEISTTNVTRWFGVTYPLIPLFLLGAYWGIRSRRREVAMLGIVVAGGALLSWFTSLPGENQYKFDFLATLAGVFVALIGWQRLFRSDRTRSIAWAAAGLALVLVVANQVIIAVGYGRSHLAAEKSIAYDGMDVVGGPASQQADAWEWIRDNTPTDAIVIVPLVSKDQARFLPISQRRAYVVRGGPYTAGNPTYEGRKDVLQAIYSPTTEPVARIKAFLRMRDGAGPDAAILAVPRSHQEQVRALELAVLHVSGGTVLYDLKTD
jgi:hypothetical protein